MRLKCLLLKSLLCSLSLLRKGWGELGKETNRKTPGRFLTKTRGDCKKICGYNQGRSYSGTSFFNGHTRTCSEHPWTFGASPWVTESKMSLRGACLHATWQSRQNKIISRDPHVSPLDFLRMTILKIGRSLDDCLRNRGMALLGIIFSLFLIFPNPSYAATYFLPDAQWDAPINVSIDSSQCELAGYTYYSSGTCPAYHNQDTCIFNDKYLKCDATEWCMDNGYTISSCPTPKNLTTKCSNNLALYKTCVCPSTYKYACSGTGYSSGNGTACDSKYTKCNCSSNYTWS